MPGALLYQFLDCSFDIESFTQPETHRPAPPTPLFAIDPCPTFYMSAGDLNSGLHACVASSLIYESVFPAPGVVTSECWIATVFHWITVSIFSTSPSVGMVTLSKSQMIV